MSIDAQSVELSLVSHTNVGKTTLARSLLGRDVGEVRDAPHVTALAESFSMIETAQGDILRLWDTPGFGDSARLAQRLAQSGNPIGWLLSQVWDRWRDRAFWSSQQAVKNVREVADVVLYLVSAAEDPAHAGYVEPEMRILEWIGKPVILLLNQVGPPRPARDEQAELQRWRSHLAAHAFVHEVMTLDAFARFWAQEFRLLDAIGTALPAHKHVGYERLSQAWRKRRLEQYEQSMRIVGRLVARVACDREALPEQSVGDRLREVGALLGAGSKGDGAKARASEQLAQRYRHAVREAADQLISLHALQGRATQTVLARVAENVSADEPVHEGRAALFGGLVSGAMSGLAADLASGGMTFGAGVLTGGLLGALGAAGLAHGFNLVRGADQTVVTWSDQFLLDLVSTQLLTYLAVAHFGRGRGEWRESEHPAFWRAEVQAVLLARRERLLQVLAERAGEARDVQLAERLQAELHDAARDVIARLYPEAVVIPAGIRP